MRLRSGLVIIGLVAVACPRQMPVCDPGSLFDDTAPLASGGGIELRATSDVPGDLRRSTTLFVRVTLPAADSQPQVFLDTDGQRTSGMWTLQSSVSAAGWNLLVSGGRLLRHQGPPPVWEWEDLGDPDVAATTTGRRMDVCVPVRALGTGVERVRIGVLAGDRWLPDAFLPGAAYPALDEPEIPAPDPDARPARLGFHYGALPWVVRDCTDPGDLECAVAVYGRFDHVVFGSGLEEADHPSHTGAAELVRGIRQAHPEVEVWGYVSLVGGPADADGRRTRVHTPADIAGRAAAWQAMGTTGIFLDECDLCRPEWGQRCALDPRGEVVAVTRAHQAAAVEAIHDLGMPVFANAFAILDILGPVDGTPTPLGGPTDDRPADAYLLENPTVSAGEVRTGLDDAVSQAKFLFAQRLRVQTGVRIGAVDTGAGGVGDDPTNALYVRGYQRAAAAGVDLYGFTNASFSAPSELGANLPILEPPS